MPWMAARTRGSSSTTNTVGEPDGSFKRLDFDGKCHVKACAARRVVGSPQAAAMRFNDGTADAKSHARAVRFGGKEGIKDLVGLLWRQPYATISDGYYSFLVFHSLRLDG